MARLTWILCFCFVSFGKQLPEENAKTIYATLLEQEAKWKVPERRVIKVRNDKIQNGDDDDEKKPLTHG